MTQGISVIIPVYNVSEYLPAALDSILSQRLTNMQIIVVDDGSNADAAERIAKACTVDPRIELVRQTNTGQSIARRNGLSRTIYEFILFLDADDIFFPGAIAHLSDTLRANPTAIAAYGAKIGIDASGNFIGRRVLPTHEQAVSGDLLPSLLQGKPILSNGSICIRRAVLEQVTFPDTLRQGEDWVTWCRLAIRGSIIYAGPRLVLGIRTHNENTSKQAVRIPSPLFRMLDVVFNAPEFIAALGIKTLAGYRCQHSIQLCRYLKNHHWHAKHPIRACWYYLRECLLRWSIPAKDPNKIRVLHVVKWFYAGGAERAISSIIEHSDRTRYEHYILSLSDENERLATIEPRLGVRYKSINLLRNKRNFWRRKISLLYMWRVQPDIVKTWLPPSNIDGGLMARRLGIPVILGIHSAQPVASHNAKQASLASRVPRRIICCSEAVHAVCQEVGYDEELLTVIHNGVDTEYFRRQVPQGDALRAKLGIAVNAPLIGMAAEFVPLKRHAYFLEAAQLLLHDFPQAQFLFCGKWTDKNNQHMQQLLSAHGLFNQVHCLGIRDDMPAIYSALDIHTQISSNESFGLANAEAMACEALCVTTDVGIMQKMLDHVGMVIAVDDDPNLLVAAWTRCLTMDRDEKEQRLERGRKRIIRDYSIRDAAARYDALYASVLNDSR